jgi:hypothetical protein
MTPSKKSEMHLEKACLNVWFSIIQNNLYYIPCYSDGNWGAWSNYSACSTTCGIGLQIRSRECNNPTPTFGGRQCLGDHGDVMFCNVTSCPNIGGINLFETLELNKQNHIYLVLFSGMFSKS